MKKLNPTIYSTNYKPTWCPGCGNFGIWVALKNALAELGIESRNVVITYDIGCIGNMASTIKCYGFHSLHGRALPVAVGAKLANPKLTVIAVAGDGGAYSEGTNHLIHTARYNADVVYIVANNRSFSLTTGQASPTSEIGYVTKTTPWGEVKQPINPIALALSAGASFVARGVAFEPKHLMKVIKSAIQHKGFSHIDVLQQCVTLNKVNTVEWYKKRMYKLQDNPEHSGKIDNLKSAFDKALESDKLPIGIFYQQKRKSYNEELDFSPDVCAVEQEIKFDKKSLLREYE
ncbi:thiamine pyrophosphate-dependent enzyme [Candidatus Parcubacteria bacterium]|nr:2-oxoacid:ferredoxin oxidoreductase subunit beta [Patescibacteria group bacterium]MCG2686827.1 thiamine pyrophosphate-dependent enzyme [Candidatus Parcubacteria bacterium]